MLTANPAHRAPPRGSAEMRRLAGGVNGFADAHESLQQRRRAARARGERAHRARSATASRR